MDDFLGTGTMMEDLRQTGTRKTPVSWSAHDFRVRPDTLSGPAALLVMIPPMGQNSPGLATGQEADVAPGKLYSLSAALVKACKEAIQGVRQSGVTHILFRIRVFSGKVNNRRCLWKCKT